MGRTSAKDAAARAKLAAAQRQEALDAMNPALRKKTTQIEELSHSTREANLRYYHKLGQHVLDVRQNADGKFGTKRDKPITLLEKALFTHKRTLRKTATFADLYSQDDLDKLVAMIDAESGFSVHWGHMSYILTLATKKERNEFAKMALTKKLDPPALHAEIKRRYGTRGASPGRKMECPKTVPAQIRQMLETTRIWIGKHDTVWYGDETNIIENVLGAESAEVGQQDLENMQALLELLEGMAQRAKQFKTPVKKAIKSMERTIADRQADLQAEETHETLDKGRQKRSIDLSSSNSNGNGQAPATPRKRRRAVQPA